MCLSCLRLPGSLAQRTRVKNREGRLGQRQRWSSGPGSGYNFQATWTAQLLRLPSWQVSEPLDNDMHALFPPEHRPRSLQRQQKSGGLCETGWDILVWSHTGKIITVTTSQGSATVHKLCYKSYNGIFSRTTPLRAYLPPAPYFQPDK